VILSRADRCGERSLPKIVYLRSKFPSLRAFSEEHGGDGSQEDDEVEPERPVVDVAEVHLDPLLEAGDGVAATCLPFAGDAGFDAEAAAVGDFGKGLDLVERQWARTDEAHVAFDDIEKLRQLIDAEFAQKFAEGENARIAVELEDRSVHLVAVFFFDLVEQLFGIWHHGTEFPHAERPAIAPRAQLREKCRGARALYADADDRENPKWQRADDDEQGCTAIEKTLEHQLPRKLRSCAQHEHRFAADGIKHWPRDLRANERGRDPCLHALQLADFYRLRDLLEVGLFGDKDDARHRFLFENVEQVVFVVGFQIEEIGNVPSGGEFLVEGVEEILHFAAGASDHDIFLGVLVERLAVEPGAGDPIADDDQQEAHQKSDTKSQAAGVELLGEDGEKADHQENDQNGPDELLDRCTAFFGPQVIVVPESLEHDRREWHGDVEHPVEGFAQACIFDAHPGLDAKYFAYDPSDPERKPDEQGVGELKQLGAKGIAAAVDH
jgi:hypothetical protein